MLSAFYDSILENQVPSLDSLLFAVRHVIFASFDSSVICNALTRFEVAKRCFPREKFGINFYIKFSSQCGTEMSLHIARFW